MLDKLRELPNRFQRDENGQAMIIAAVLAFVLMRSTAMSFNVGVAVAERIRTQVVADMAAYSGAVWQARFLNYCAYTRRAIIANYANVAMMSAISQNKRLMDGVTDASTLFITFFVDNGSITSGLNATQSIRDFLVPGDDDSFGNPLPNMVDGRMIAELEAQLLSHSQEALFWAITPVEGIQARVVADVFGGANHPSNLPIGDPNAEMILANNQHLSLGITLGPLTFPLSTFWNMGIIEDLGGEEPAILGQPESFPIYSDKGLIDRQPIPQEAIEAMWDEGFTKVTLPPHIGQSLLGLPATMGRNFLGLREFPSCNDVFFMETQIFTTSLELFIWDLPFMPSPLPFTEMTDDKLWSSASNFIHNDSSSLIDFGTGFWWLFYISFSTPWGCITIAVGFPIILFDFPNFGEEQDDDYEFLQPVSETLVYEIKGFDRASGTNDFSSNPRLLEPDVYAAVARQHETVDYLRLSGTGSSVRAMGLLDDGEGRMVGAHAGDDVFPGRLGNGNKDIVALSRAKVTFSPPSEISGGAPAALTTGGARIPNMNYPFWSARLARLEHGHNFSGGVTNWKTALGGIPADTSWQSLQARGTMGLGLFGNTDVKY